MKQPANKFEDKSENFEAKKHFDDQYTAPTPVRFYHEVLSKATLDMGSRDVVLSKYVERNFLNMFNDWAKIDLDGKKLKVVDFMTSYGNTTLSLTRCFNQDDFKCWSKEETCYNLKKERQFPCVTYGFDLSEPAIKYALKAKIFDVAETLNLNSMTPEREREIAEHIRSSNITSINSFGYQSDETPTKVIKWFAEGTAPGLLILGFSSPYDGLERVRIWKKLALEKLDFFDNFPCKQRNMTKEEEEFCFKEYGIADTTFAEYWFLLRK